MSLALLNVLVTGVISLAGVGVSIVAIRATRRGAHETVELGEKSVVIEGKRVDLSILQASVESLQSRLDDVEERLEHSEEQRKLSNAYARTLAEVLRMNSMPVPQPPAGLDLP